MENMEMSAEQLRDEYTNKVLNHDFATGPLLIIAGPGTGKTYSLRETIRKQMSNFSLSDFYTFSLTNATVRDFEQEVRDKVDDEFRGVSTLHFRAKKVVHQYCGTIGLPEDFGILSKAEAWIVIHDVHALAKSRGVSIDGRKLNSLLKNYQEITANLGKDNSFFGSQFASLQRFYNAMDWYDLVKFACLILEDNHNARDAETSKLEFLLIDEYQDLNVSERRLVRLLCNGRSTLLAVGDPAQSIYSGRFADPTGITSFTKDYPSAEQIPLPVCSRCPAQVLKAAHNLISENDDFEAGEPLTPLERSQKRTGGGFVASVRLAGSKIEAQFIARALRLLQDKGVPPNQVLVLVSNKNLGKTLFQQVLEADAELVLQSELDGDLEMTDIAHYFLRLHNNPNDNLALRMLLHFVAELKYNKVCVLLIDAFDNERTLWDTLKNAGNVGFSTRYKNKLSKFVDSMEALLSLPAHEALRSLATSFPKYQDEFTQAADALEQPAPDEMQHDDEERVEPLKTIDGYRFMTLHSSKGLDADYVIMPFLEDEVALPGKDLNEQRRLLYVGLTRAKCGVICTWAKVRPGKQRHQAGGGEYGNRHRTELLKNCGIKGDTKPNAAIWQLERLVDAVRTFDIEEARLDEEAKAK